MITVAKACLKWMVAVVAATVLVTGGLSGCSARKAPPVTPPAPAPGPAPAPSPGPAPAPTPAPAPAPAGKLKVSVVAKGSLGLSGEVDIEDARGPYLAVAQGSSAYLYRFDAGGSAQRVNTVSDDAAGLVGSVSLGDVSNNGTTVMAVVYENKLYLANDQGKVDSSAAKDLYNYVTADLDGDGKNESLSTYLETYQVSRTVGGQTQKLYEVKGEEPVRYGATHQRLTHDYFAGKIKSGSKELLVGTVQSKEGNFALLYEWTSTGAKLVRKVAFDNPPEAEAYEVTAGTTKAGPVVVVSHSGAKPYFDVIEPETGAVLQRVDLQGSGNFAVQLGSFTGGPEQQVLALDENGNYTVYSLEK